MRRQKKPHDRNKTWFFKINTYANTGILLRAFFVSWHDWYAMFRLVLSFFIFFSFFWMKETLCIYSLAKGLVISKEMWPLQLKQIWWATTISVYTFFFPCDTIPILIWKSFLFLRSITKVLSQQNSALLPNG